MADILIAIQGDASSLVAASSQSVSALGAVDAAAGKTVTGFQRGQQAAATFATSLTAIAAMGVVGAVGAMTSAAMGFEKQMSNVGAVAGATAQEMQTLTQLALDLGKSTSFSATEAAQGLEELVKAGVGITDMMSGGAKAALDLAAAGGVAVADAAEIASNAMNVFGLEGADMARIANLIAGAANASAISVNDYKFSLSAAGAVAATVGVGFEDLTTAIALMGNAGIKGSDAGTSLKTMLLNLSPSTKPAIGAMRELGILTADGANAFFTAEGKAKSLAEIAGVLQEATAHLTQEQKLNALQTIFGTDAIRAAAVMANAGADGFLELATAVGKVTAAEVADQRLNNLTGSIEKFKGAAETAAITVGMGITPALKSLTDTATEALNGVMPQIEGFSTALGEQLPGAINSLTTAGQSVVTWFRGLPEPLQNAAVAFGVVAAAALPATAALRALPFVLGVIAAPLTALISPLGLLAVGVGALAAAWTVNLGGIQEKTTAVLDVVGPAFQALGPIVSQALAGDVGGAITAFIGLVGSVATQLQPLLTTWGQEFVTWIAVAGPPMLAAAAQLGADLLAWIGAQIPPLLAQLALWGQEFIAWVAPTIPPLLAALTNLGSQVLTWVAAQIPPIIAQLLLWGQEFVAWVAPQIPLLLTALGQLYVSLNEWLIAQIPGITAELVKWGILFGAWVVTTAIPELVKALPGIITTISSWVGTAATEIARLTVAAGVALAQGIFEGFMQAWPIIKGKITEALGSISLPSWMGGGGGGATPMSYQGSPDSESKLRRAYEIARSKGFTEDQANAMLGTLRVEGGLQGAVGDSGQSFGPFQLYAGGQLPNFAAWLKQKGIDGDPRQLANDIDLSTNFALDNYYGGALRAGTAAGLSGPALATYAQRHGQVSINPEKAGGAYGPPSGGVMPRLPLGTGGIPGGLPGSDPSHWPPLIDEVIAVSDDWRVAMAEISTSGQMTFGTVADAGLTAGATLVSASTDSLGNVTRIYSEAGVVVGATITDAAGVVVNAWGTMATGVVAQTDLMASGALTSVTELGTGTLTTVQDMAGTTVATVTDMAGNVTSQSATLASGVSLNLHDMNVKSTQSVDAMTGQITTNMTDAAGNVVTTVTDASGKVVSQFATMAGQTVTSAQTMQTGAVAAATAMSRDTATAAVTMGTDVVDAISAMVSDAADSFTTLVGDAGDAGSALEALGEITIPAPDIEDVLNAMEEVKEAAEDAADAIKDITQANKGGGKAPGLGKSSSDAYLIPNEPVRLVPDASSRGSLGSGDVGDILAGLRRVEQAITHGIAQARTIDLTVNTNASEPSLMYEIEVLEALARRP